MSETLATSPMLVLAPNVTIEPAHDISGSGIGDVIIDRCDLRQHARLANAPIAALLEQFRAPSRLPNAVARMARDQGLDPYLLLSDAAPIIDELVASGVLQSPDETTNSERSFSPGVQIGDYSVRKVLRQTLDTEVALAVCDEGRPFALKTLQAGANQTAIDAFMREIEIARQLSGTLAPTFIEVINEASNPVLVTQWIEALPLDRYVSLCCSTTQDRLALCQSVTRTFAKLHAQGILHGDIRPSNILVDGYGKVFVLDFGLSQWSGEKPLRYSFELAYLEPESVDALVNAALPALTERGEVCALGLVLAEAILGHPVRTLPELRDEALSQIAAEKSVVRTGWAALNKVLNKAIAPPEERFASMELLTDALDILVPRAPKVNQFSTLSAETNAATDNAYLNLRRAELTSDPDQLTWAARHLRIANQTGFRGIDKVDPLHTPVATLLLRSRLAYASRNFTIARECLNALPEAIDTTNRPTELFSGTGGDLVHVARFFADYQKVDEQTGILGDLIDTLIGQQSKALSTTLANLRQGGRTHLGMAHGLAGQLYAILVATNARQCCVNDVTQDGLDVLASFKRTFGTGIAWPGTLYASPSDPVTADFMPGWCNGTAGYLMLWVEAEKALADGRSYALAEASARYTLAHPDMTPNLCCGLSGRSIALSTYASWTNSDAWKEKALSLADRAEQQPKQVLSGSIFRGVLGITLARLEVSSVPHSRFPI